RQLHARHCIGLGLRRALRGRGLRVLHAGDDRALLLVGEILEREADDRQVILRVVLGGELGRRGLRILVGGRGERAVDEGGPALRQVHSLRLGPRGLRVGRILGILLLCVLRGRVLLGGLLRFAASGRILRRGVADAAGDEQRDGGDVQQTISHGGPPDDGYR